MSRITKIKIRYRTALLLVLVVIAGLLNSKTGLAGMFGSAGVDIPDTDETAGDAEQRYNVNTGTIKEMGQGSNVAGRKAGYPGVQVFFTPSDPKSGEKITASATPQYFVNNKEELYYTWYIKHKGCCLTAGPGYSDHDARGLSDPLTGCEDGESAPLRGTDEFAACDVDGNGDITVEDWKIEAMRTIVNGGYNTAKTPFTDDPKFVEDSDGYVAYVGGDKKYRPKGDSGFPDQTKAEGYCYIHNDKDGIDYEMKDDSSSSNRALAVCGNSNYAPVCLESGQNMPLTEALNPPEGISSTPVTVSGGTLSAGTYAYRIASESQYSQSRANTVDITCTIGSISMPSNFSVSAISGGSLVTGTYDYRVATLDTGTGVSTATLASTCNVNNGGGTNRCSISWSAVAGAGGYRVYRSTDGGSTWQYVDLGGSQVSLDDVGGTGYTSGGPVGTGTAQTGNACQINWTDEIGAERYLIYGRTSPQNQMWVVNDPAPAVRANESFVDSGVQGQTSSAPSNPTIYKQFSTANSCLGTGSVPNCASGSASPVCQTDQTAACVPLANVYDTQFSDTQSCEDVGGVEGYITTQGLSAPTCQNITLITDARACGHLFPLAYNDSSYTTQLVTTNGTRNITINGGTDTGDGKFDYEEEVFWHSNPEDPDTPDVGFPDEAIVSGLGQRDFTWNYQAGDKVGVGVEGTSMTATKHEDSTNMVMWAFPNGKCTLPSREPQVGSYQQKIKGYYTTFPTVGMNLNSCIPENLMDPTQKIGEKLETQLSFVPDNPVNDPSADKMGDQLVVNASISNAPDGEQKMEYDWHVYITRGGRLPALGWEDITQRLVRWGDTGLTKGNNLSSLKVNLNLSNDDIAESGTPLLDASGNTIAPGLTAATLNDYFPPSGGGIGYIKVELVVDDPHDIARTREGKSDVIIKVASTDKRINAHRVSYTGDPRNIASPGGGLDLADKICYEELRHKAICFVAKNEIIGLKVDNDDNKLTNFYWSVNGEKITCNSSISPNCNDNTQTNVTFLPITGNPGDTYSVSMTANDTTSPNGKNIELTRTFQVVDPYIDIESMTPVDIAGSDNETDVDQVHGYGAWPKVVGKYATSSSVGSTVKFADTSNNTFETYPSNEVTLRGRFHPSWLSLPSPTTGASLATSQFFIDEVKSDTLSEAGTEYPYIQFNAAKSVGSSYDIKVNSIYTPDPAIRQALKDLWGVSEFDTKEVEMTSQISVEVNDRNVGMTPKGLRGFMASIYTNAPGYIMFLLRVILTVMIIVFTSGLIFSVVPNPYDSKDER